jgi:hypothetical protein
LNLAYHKIFIAFSQKFIALPQKSWKTSFKLQNFIALSQKSRKTVFTLQNFTAFFQKSRKTSFTLQNFIGIFHISKSLLHFPENKKNGCSYLEISTHPKPHASQKPHSFQNPKLTRITHYETNTLKPQLTKAN